jgi:acetyltransferase-like isoleucine patch superfamily enzyme
MKRALKTIAQGIALALTFLPAAASSFGRSEGVYLVFAHALAVVPSTLGDYLRIAYYKLTLRTCSLSSRISFGSFFAHTDAELHANVYIGSYAIIGRAVIGERTQIASGVQILSGAQQHVRDGLGRISGAKEGVFRRVNIGADCWIGAAAVLMADVGEGSTIGAGSLVSRPIPSHSVAVGNPARVIRSAAVQSE